MIGANLSVAHVRKRGHGFQCAATPSISALQPRTEIAMRPDVEAMKADIEQSVALLRRRL